MDKELIELLGREHGKKIENLGDDPDFGEEHHASYLSIRRRLRDHEGFVTHMYRDSDKGKVTVGIGFLLDTEAKLSEFVWHNRFSRRTVNTFFVAEEWNRVRRLPHGPAYSAAWYKKFTALDIQEIKINLTLDSKLRRLHSDLRRHFKNRLDINFDELPATVQEAFFDMGWTSGAGFISNTKKGRAR